MLGWVGLLSLFLLPRGLNSVEGRARTSYAASLAVLGREGCGGCAMLAAMCRMCAIGFNDIIVASKLLYRQRATCAGRAARHGWHGGSWQLTAAHGGSWRFMAAHGDCHERASPVKAYSAVSQINHREEESQKRQSISRSPGNVAVARPRIAIIFFYRNIPSFPKNSL